MCRNAKKYISGMTICTNVPAVKNNFGIEFLDDRKKSDVPNKNLVNQKNLIKCNTIFDLAAFFLFSSLLFLHVFFPYSSESNLWGGLNLISRSKFWFVFRGGWKIEN